MALFEEGALGELFGSSLGAGLLIGAGVFLLGPILASTIGRTLRPVAKQAIKAGMGLYETGRSAAGEASAGMRELVDESRAELAPAGDVPSDAATPKPRRSKE